MENNNIIKVLVAIIVIFIITTVVLMVKLYSPSITGNFIKSSSGEETGDKGGLLRNLPIKDKEGKSIAESIGSKLTATSTVSTKETISNLIELKIVSKNKDTLRIAELVTLINRYIEENSDNNLLNNWQRNIVGCVYAGSCADTAYLQLIDAVVLTDLSNKNNLLVHSIIETTNLWNNQNLVLFSDSLAQTNRLVKEYSNANVKDQWNALVACNAQCSDYSDKLFALIKSAANA